MVSDRVSLSSAQQAALRLRAKTGYMTITSCSIPDMTSMSDITDMEQASTACPLPRKYPFSRHRLEQDPLYAQLRQEEPVCRIQLPYGPPAWLVTTHQLAKAVLADSRFSREATIGRDTPRYVPVDPGQVPESMLSMDPPRHTRIRQLVGRALTARRVEQFRPRVRQIASGLIDDMDAAGAPADLVESFSFPLPSTVICELLGIPWEDRDTFRGWADGTVSTAAVTPEEQQNCYLHLAGYLAGQFEQRRSHPGDDLLTWLVQARDEQDRLTEGELLFLGMALLVGGYETTARQITNMVYMLLTHPQQLGELRSRPELLPTAVDELLRFIAFGTAVNPRIATTDVQVGDILVRAGEPVLCANGSANNDESVFSDPGELDLARHPNPHLAFGHGPHVCIGAQLARLELQVSLEAILSRLPGLRIAVPESDLAWETQSLMRGLTAFPVRWDADGASPARQLSQCLFQRPPADRARLVAGQQPARDDRDHRHAHQDQQQVGYRDAA
jgi:cytochrome P450